MAAIPSQHNVPDDRMRSDVAAATEIALSTDEPKGVPRVGIMMTMIVPDVSAICRHVFKLAPLEDTVDEDGFRHP